MYSTSEQEIATLRKEAQAFKVVRNSLRDNNATNAAKLAFEKVGLKELCMTQDLIICVA